MCPSFTSEEPHNVIPWIEKQDFYGAAAKVAQRDSKLVEMYLFVAVVYFVLCYSLSFAVKHLQRKIAVIR
jgi:glutamate/aspartate transport system permease protein